MFQKPKPFASPLISDGIRLRQYQLIQIVLQCKIVPYAAWCEVCWNSELIHF